MKEKIIAAIKAKFPAINLSKSRLDAVAARIELDVVDDETKIDASIDLFNRYNPFEEIAKNDDAIRNLKSKVDKPTTPKKEEKPDVETPEEAPPSWVKGLIEKIEKLEKEKSQSSIQKKLGDKIKDVPASFWNKRTLPENEEGIDAFADEVKADYTTFLQETTNIGLKGVPLPGGSQKEPTGAVSADIKAFVAKQAEVKN